MGTEPARTWMTSPTRIAVSTPARVCHSLMRSHLCAVFPWRVNRSAANDSSQAIGRREEHVGCAFYADNGVICATGSNENRLANALRSVLQVISEFATEKGIDYTKRSGNAVCATTAVHICYANLWQSCVASRHARRRKVPGRRPQHTDDALGTHRQMPLAGRRATRKSRQYSDAVTGDRTRTNLWHMSVAGGVLLATLTFLKQCGPGSKRLFCDAPTASSV